MFVEASIHDQFLEKLVQRTRAMKIGDPFADDTTVGATITRQQADKVLQYVDIARKEVRNFFFIDFDIMFINHVNYLLVISIILVVCHNSGNGVSIDRDCNSYVDVCYSSQHCLCKSRLHNVSVLDYEVNVSLVALNC